MIGYFAVMKTIKLQTDTKAWGGAHDTDWTESRHKKECTTEMVFLKTNQVKIIYEVLPEY